MDGGKSHRKKSHSASGTFSLHAFAYQDYIIVIGRTLEEDKKNLREVFRRLIEAKLKLNS